MSSNKPKGSISFRFNKSGEDHIEEVHNFNDDRSSGVNSEANSRASTPMKSETSKLSDILSPSLSSSTSSSSSSSFSSSSTTTLTTVTSSKVKSSISDNSVKDFFTSKLNRGRSFDHHGSSDDSSIPSSSSPGSSSKWFNESWRKFQQIIEERKEKSAREKEKDKKEKDSIQGITAITSSTVSTITTTSSSSFSSSSSSGGGSGNGGSLTSEKVTEAFNEFEDIGERNFRSFSLTEPINDNLIIPSSLASLQAKLVKDDADGNHVKCNNGDAKPRDTPTINYFNNDDDDEDDEWLFRRPPITPSVIKPNELKSRTSMRRNDENENKCEPTPSTIAPISPSESSQPSQRSINHEWWIWNSQSGFLSFSAFLALVAFIITTRLPFPSYVNGFILGVVISFLFAAFFILYLANWFFKPSEEEENEALIKASNESSSSSSHPIVSSTTISSSDPSSTAPSAPSTPLNEIQQTKEDAGDSQTVIHKEWFHELVSSRELETSEKASKKHAKTQLVFVRLQGTCLRVSEPQSKNIKPRKLAENSYTNFASQRHYDLINLKRLYLWLPNSIRNKKKYLWVKKYPIILEIDGNKSYNESSSSNGGGTTTGRTTKLILFARTHRSKEEWYWRLKDASRDFFLDSAEELKSDSEQTTSSTPTPDSNSNDHSPSTPTRETFKSKDVTPSSINTKYEAYMHQILNHRISLYLPGTLPVDDSHLLWFNVMLGRVLFEFLNNSHWSNWASKKIQRKLSRIKLPYFMQTLTLKNIDLGQNLPRFLSVPQPPVINESGLWIDFQIDYCGGFAMTLETKLNLMRLKDQGTVEKEMKPFRQGMGNSVEIDDFSEPESIVSSSGDDEKDEFKEKISDSEGNNGTKILKLVDKLAASKYFQQATDNKYIKRAMEGVSNTPLVLTVFVQELSGTLAINIPPPPSDRLWYGFRGDPNLVLSARPRLGEHRVSMSHAIEWIEKKLQQEFNKFLVIPNMDDIILSVMMASNNNIDIQ